jgi:hypothetical protein
MIVCPMSQDWSYTHKAAAFEAADIRSMKK